MNARRTLRTLDTVSRRRPLTLAESLRLERASRIVQQGRRLPYWHPEEDEIASTLRSRGETYSRISREIPRTPDAIAARLRYLERGL